MRILKYSFIVLMIMAIPLFYSLGSGYLRTQTTAQTTAQPLWYAYLLMPEDAELEYADMQMGEYYDWLLDMQCNTISWPELEQLVQSAGDEETASVTVEIRSVNTDTQTQAVPVQRESGAADAEHLDESLRESLRLGISQEALEGLTEEAARLAPDEIEIPILLYHHLAEESDGSMTVSERTFRSQIEAVRDAGYNAITFDQLIAYVEYGSVLPEKPVIIAFDDGYLSNYEIAYPVLQDAGLKGTIFPIGVSIGKDVYKDTGISMYPHFGIEEMQEMTESGVISIQSHSYDMHHVKELDDADTFRKGVLQIEGETDADYQTAFYSDTLLSKELLESITGEPVVVFSYPYGAYNAESEEWLEDMGFKVTLITGYSSNTVVKGSSDSLKLMGKYYIIESDSPADVLALLP